MRGAFLASTLVLLAIADAAAAAPIPIPGDTLTGRPANDFEGATATPRRLASPAVPQHPFMAPNGNSNLHEDAYQTDASVRPGPLGNDMEVLSSFQFLTECGTITIDSRGRLVSVCVPLQGPPRLTVFDPKTLDSLAVMLLPLRQVDLQKLFTDVSGGGYFYLDHRDRAIVPTSSRHIFVVAVGPEPTLTLEHDYDLTGVVPQGDKIFSALPDWSGRLWFITADGLVGSVNPDTGEPRTLDLNETIGNSFAIDDDGGVYVVTTKALYRLTAAADGTPTLLWREPYENIGELKPGQLSAGSGTTPTVMGSGYVTITDNADPMNVLVYKRRASVRGSRLVCRQPVFEQGASATDQSLIAVGNSIIVENNYGYASLLTSTEGGRSTSPGLERVDLNAGGRGCHSVWRSSEIAPSVVPKVSLETGLVYTYTKPPRDDGIDAWYLTALDFCSGRTVYRKLTGTGAFYNNHYAPVTFGPDGTVYLGTAGGILLVRDRTPPTGPPAGSARGCEPGPLPRLRLRLRFRRGRTVDGRRCALPPVRARVRGRGIGQVTSVVFRRNGRRVARDRKAPFARVIDRRGRRGRQRVRAMVRLADGRLVRLRRAYRSCGT